jgi:hypothetical protein
MRAARHRALGRFSEVFMSRFDGALAATFLSAAVSFASAVVVPILLAAGASAATAAAADDAPKSAAPAGASSKPMIIHNPDGTFTIQKEPPDGTSNDAKAKEGLVIPPQVVVPLYLPRSPHPW